jgi:SAM-dependent methyltransferase
MASDDRYLLGMAPAEIERLERQHVTWRRETERAWDRAGFREGQTIVDLGCGPGFTSLDLAARVGPAGRVIAVDASPVAAAHLREAAAAQGYGNLEIVTADVEHVDLRAWRPDGVFARWLFCYLPSPELVVSHVASALSSGGTAAIVDYWNYLAIRTEPDSALFRRVFGAVYRSFADAGGSLDIAGRLPDMFDANGLQVASIEPLCQTGRPGSPTWRWIDEFQALYLPTLVEKEMLTQDELDAYLTWWHALAASPHAFVFSPPMLAIVAAKP